MFRFTLYSDFDGVTNAPNPLFDRVYTAEVAVDDHPYLRDPSVITFAAEVIKAIEGLRSGYGVELVWATTWNHNDEILSAMDQIGVLAGGRVLPAALNREAKGKAEWTQWKADAIVADAAARGCPFIWVDDNAPKFWAEYVSERVTVPHLIVISDSESGITADDLARMEAFLSSEALSSGTV